MLVDGAKYGDVEIPVFCYEPKLGQPVGACRMCLVEIEGIPKLQTACSTAIRDGMVVHTQTERVHEAQRAVVEFLLINHPLDCPVCDKGGECPLQDITYGWGPGTSRFIEPKRHFKKPLELSPLIAIDRERCILCYRCVRYSQEIAEDYQLILLERGAHELRRHVRRAPVRRARSAATSSSCARSARSPRAPTASERARGTSRARARSAPAAPAQCNVELTVRDERVMRVLGARPRRGRRRLAVRQGPLRLPGRARRRPARPAAGARGRRADARELGEGARRGRRRAEEGGRPRVGARRRRRRPTRRPSCSQSLCPRRTSARATSARGPAASSRSTSCARSPDPALQATVPDLEFAHTVLLVDCDPIDDAPILDLRIRKGVAPPRHQARRRQRAPDGARPQRRGRRASLRAGRRRGVPGRARRRALRRRGQPRRRGQRRGHERHRRARVRRRAARRGRGDRDRLRRAAAARPGGPRAAQPRRAARTSPASPAPGCSSCRPRRTAAACARRASPPATAPATPLVAARRPRRPRASPRDWRAASCTRSGCTTPTRCAAPGPRGCGTARCHRADRDRRRLGADRHDPRARRRRLPRRGLRREGGHARASRRPRAAPAPGDRRALAGALDRPGGRRAALWQVIADVVARARPRRRRVPTGAQASRAAVRAPCRSTRV